MDHYYRQIVANLKRISLREQATEQTFNDPRLPSDRREQLLQQYKQYTWKYYGIRSIPFVFTGLYVASRFGRQTSPFLLKEIGLVIGLSYLVLYLDYKNSDSFWTNNGEIVQEISNYSDLMVMDNQKLDQMREMYAKGKRIGVQPENYKPAEKKSDKMYDD